MTSNCIHLVCLILLVSSCCLKNTVDAVYVGTVKQKMRELFNVSGASEIRLWDCSGFHEQILTSHKQTLYDGHISETQVVVNISK